MEMHKLPDSWEFDGNLSSPTFRPSFKHSGLKVVKVDGKWTGDWVHDAQGNTVPDICHYNVTAGQLQYCNDCTHEFINQTIPIPDLPEELTDAVLQ